jgi:ABC-type multidrug transport system permease subunit
MRWLFVKDLQILRRSPLVTTLLVVYPAVIAVLIGFAISRGPEKPRIAFLSQVPANQQLTIGSRNFDIVGARSELFSRLDVVRVSSRAQAERLVRDGDVLGALILPPDLIAKLRSTGLQQPSVEVIVNQEDPVKERLVDDRIRGLLTEANLRLSHEFSTVTLDYLGLLLRGGTFHIFGQSLDILGLTQTERILTSVQRDLNRGDPNRLALGQVIRFSNLARQNLSLADNLLASVAEPIKVRKTVVSGQTPALDSFAIAVAATLTLMFVTVLLVAGSLALEREENAFARLTRGLVHPEALLGEKVALGVACSLLVTLLMLAVLQIFVPIRWSRAPIFVAAILAGGAGFAALGAAIGSAAREVRASSLLAFMVSLPVALLSLVPSGAVGPGLLHAIRVVVALFPFRPALQAIEGGLDPAGPGLLTPLLHLTALVVAYLALSRLALRRFTAS